MSGKLEELLARAEEFATQIRDLDAQRTELAVRRRIWIRAAVDEAGMDQVAQRLGLSRGQLAKLLNGTRV